MSGYHFFDKDQWHRTETQNDEKCTCGVAVGGKVRPHSDNSWEFSPPESLGKCFDALKNPQPTEEKQAAALEGYVEVADHALQLAAENQLLRTKLDEHELLFGVATHTDDFLTQLLDGLGPNLPPGTERTVEAIVAAVADMALKLDCHEDASTPAFDEIAKLCGVPTWEYPGQVVRDVEHVVKERDALATRRDELLATIARLSQTLPFPDEIKNWEATRATMVAEIGTLKAKVAEYERNGRKIDQAFIDDLTEVARSRRVTIDKLTAELDEANTLARVQQGNVAVEREERLRLRKKTAEMLKKIEEQTAFLSGDQVRLIKERDELREEKNGAYRERDKCVVGLAAMAIRLGWKAWLGRHVGDPWDDDWRNIIFINLPTGQVSWHIHDSELPFFDFLDENEERTWDGHTTEQKYERLLALADHAAPYRPDGCSNETHPDHNCDASCSHCPDCGSNIDRHVAHLKKHIAELEANAVRMREYRFSLEGIPTDGNGNPVDERGTLVPEPRADGVATYIPGYARLLDEAREEEPDMRELAAHAQPTAAELRAELEACRGALRVIAGYTPGEASEDTDPAIALAGLAQIVLGEKQSSAEATKRCGCSEKYREMRPGWHARYCVLAGLPLEPPPA